MATKIRLQRHGHKGHAFYKIVVADSRAPRDGRFIERIGSYNPNTNPATIDLNFERALYWLGVGAQPTDTARNILSREGVLLKKHLLGGVEKGAFDEAWRKKKQDALNAVTEKCNEAKAKANAERLSAEQEINKVKAQALSEKRAAEAKAKAEEEAAKEAEEAAAISAETPAVEEEAPAAEAPAEA